MEASSKMKLQRLTWMTTSAVMIQTPAAIAIPERILMQLPAFDIISLAMDWMNETPKMKNIFDTYSNPSSNRM
jgi:hypothetical protein